MKTQLRSAPPSPEDYFDALFANDEARGGGIVQISQLDMERAVGRDRFVDEMKARHFTALVNRGQIIIICNNKDLRLLA